MSEEPNSPGLGIDLEKLRRFEEQLDARRPEESGIPARILGFGEISTVLEIDLGTGAPLACKRMPMFKSPEEARRFGELYDEYLSILREKIGLNVVAGEFIWITESGRVTAYIIQNRLPPETIGNRVIHGLPRDEAVALALAVVAETAKVFDFNLRHRGELEVAIDGQISNWAVADSGQSASGADVRLVYFDTSSPFITRAGVEQLDPELFLRSAPSFLVWILRIFFLKDVMQRYYDFRKVCIDLIANFYKEQLSDLVPDLVAAVNRQLSGRADFEPLTVSEIRAYYREDAWIWRLYLAFRKVDRALHHLIGRPYPYILPDRIRR